MFVFQSRAQVRGGRPQDLSKSWDKALELSSINDSMNLNSKPSVTTVTPWDSALLLILCSVDFRIPAALSTCCFLPQSENCLQHDPVFIFDLFVSTCFLLSGLSGVGFPGGLPSYINVRLWAHYLKNLQTFTWTQGWLIRCWWSKVKVILTSYQSRDSDTISEEGFKGAVAGQSHSDDRNKWGD